MMKIISFKICPFVQRVTGMLEAKKLAYEIEYISLKDKPDWFLEISPTAQVPVLITDDGDVLHESDAIVEYIDEISDPLNVNLTPAQRAQERAWSFQASKHYLVQCSTMQSTDRSIFSDRIEKLNKAFEKIEKQLSGNSFFNGARLGNVEIAWLPLLHRAKLVQDHSGYDLLAPFPKVKKWQQAILDPGLAEKTVSADFSEQFSGFYLSDHTFLGRGADFNESCDAIDGHNSSASCCG